jgi:DNA polymerase III subunit delta
MTDTIKQLIKSGKLPAVLLLFGEEEFLIEEDYNALINSILKDPSYSYDFEVMDGDTATPDRIAQSCTTFPFVAPVRVVVVNHFEKVFAGNTTKKGLEKTPLGSYLLSPQASTFLILKVFDDSLKGMSSAKSNMATDQKSAKKVKSAKFPYNIVLEKHVCIEYPKIYESAIPKWINLRVKSLGKTIDTDAVEFLAAHVHPNIRMIYNEIEKLLLHIQDSVNITANDVKFIVGASREYNVFEFQNAVGQRNLAKATEILTNMLASDRQEMLIMTMLARYFLVMFKLIEKPSDMNDKYTIAAHIGVSPFFVQDYISAARKYTPDELERAFILMAETDEKLKSTSIDSLALLQQMLVRIMIK